MMNNPISSDLIRGHIDTIVLHSLSKNDMHAQQISDFIEEKSNNQYKINQATLYSSLKRLENLKYVSSYYNDSENGRRKYFHILDKGLEYANNNLNAWSESKSIIDKLMDLESERVVFVTHNNTQNNQVNTSENLDLVAPSNSSTKNDTIDTKNDVIDIKPVEETTDSVEVPPANNNVNNNNSNNVVLNESVNNQQSDDNKEINFRAILNSLIKNNENSEVKNDTVETEPEPLNIVIAETESPSSKMKFNETISVTDYNAKKTNNDGKIDFGDLTIKAEKEGYKVRISSKEASRSNGFVYVNKLHFLTSLVMFFVAIAEFVFLKALTPYIFNDTIVIASLSVITFVPLVNLIVLLCNKNKKRTKKYTMDSVLVSAIVLFNVILINLAILFILNVDLTERFNLVAYFVVPLFVYLDIVIYYVIRNAISKSKKISIN